MPRIFRRALLLIACFASTRERCTPLAFQRHAVPCYWMSASEADSAGKWRIRKPFRPRACFGRKMRITCLFTRRFVCRNAQDWTSSILYRTRMSCCPRIASIRLAFHQTVPQQALSASELPPVKRLCRSDLSCCRRTACITTSPKISLLARVDRKKRLCHSQHPTRVQTVSRFDSNKHIRCLRVNNEMLRSQMLGRPE